MSGLSPLELFVESEFGHAATLIEKVLDDALAFMVKPPEPISAQDRALAIDVAVVMRPARRQMAQAYVQSLRDQAAALAAGVAPSSAPATAGPRRGLSLVAESAVSSDVLLSQCVAEIKATAESELRELTALSSSLAGDRQVLGERTPFGAEAQARALWAAAGVLHSGGGLREGFLKFVARPFSRELRKHLAEACSQLEASGVEPASYGAVVSSGTARSVKAPESGTAGATLRAAAPSAPAAQPAAGADPTYLDLVGRIFDHFLADRDLPADVRLAISHLISPGIRLATVDASLLDAQDHALWRFIDRIAWQVQVLPAASHHDRRSAFRFIETLIAQITNQGAGDPKVFAYALGSLEAAERQRFEDRRRMHAKGLADLEAEDFPATEPAPLDHGASHPSQARDLADLDTAPAALLESVPKVDARRRDGGWIASLRPGDVARILLEKEWRHVQMLGIGPQRRVAYLADCRSEQGWALGMAALEALAREGLAAPLSPRSLLKAAARAVASQVGT